MHVLPILVVLASAPSPRPAAPIRVLVDAGHGAPGNRGARTVLEEDEADVMLELATDLAARLRAIGGFEVKLTRSGRDAPSYPARKAQAEAFHADAVLSLHLDARAGSPTATSSTAADVGAQGVAVLYADLGGDAALIGRRRTLARALARSIRAEGLPLYGGEDYGGLYEFDPTPGVYVDRRGIFFLRRFTRPTVIIETQQGLSIEDRHRWQREDTRARFARAVAAALVEAARGGADAGPRRAKDGGVVVRRE